MRWALLALSIILQDVDHCGPESSSAQDSSYHHFNQTSPDNTFLTTEQLKKKL